MEEALKCPWILVFFLNHRDHDVEFALFCVEIILIS